MPATYGGRRIAMSEMEAVGVAPPETVPSNAYEAIGVGADRGGLLSKGGTGWPSTTRHPEAVRIRFEAGYDANAPQVLPVKQAVVLGATHLRSLSTRELSLSSRSVDGVGTRSWIVSDAAEKLVRNAVEHLLTPLRIYA